MEATDDFEGNSSGSNSFLSSDSLSDLKFIASSRLNLVSYRRPVNEKLKRYLSKQVHLADNSIEARVDRDNLSPLES
ncbi:MAG: hypothetical protein AAF202_12185, partial [Pseudomonadota bacterium]